MVVTSRRWEGDAKAPWYILSFMGIQCWSQKQHDDEWCKCSKVSRKKIHTHTNSNKTTLLIWIKQIANKRNEYNQQRRQWIFEGRKLRRTRAESFYKMKAMVMLAATGYTIQSVKQTLKGTFPIGSQGFNEWNISKYSVRNIEIKMNFLKKQQLFFCLHFAMTFS